METATFAAGCFWGVQAEFARMDGVVETTAGYTGGHFDHPGYRDVCSGRTGHAEAVEIKFDPERVSYAQLLDKFFSLHDPTQLNRQGPDWGEQYRGAIFFHSPEQERRARETVDRLSREKRFPGPIVTQILPAGPFWPAEDYHQNYLEKRGMASCHAS